MANIALKIKTKSGQQVIDSLTTNSSIKDLKQILSNIAKIPIGRLQVLSGFPPKILNISDNNGTLSKFTYIYMYKYILNYISNYFFR